jgi:hypothetical protein
MPTFTQIGSAVTVGSGGAADITFTAIPATYTDLVLKLSLRGSSASLQDNVLITFNGSSSGYSARLLYGQGSGTPASASSSSSSLNLNTYVPALGATSSTFGNAEIYIPNYASSANKSVSSDFVIENNATATFMGLAAGLWSNSAAITQITIDYLGSDNFAQHSTAYLYGVSNA